MLIQRWCAGSAGHHNFRCWFRESDVELADGGRRGDHKCAHRGPQPPTDIADRARDDADRAVEGDGHLKEHAVATRDGTTQAEPRTVAPDRSYVPCRARRPRRRPRGRRPADPATATEARCAGCRAAHRAPEWNARLEGGDPARAQAATTQVARRVRVVVRTQRRVAVAARRPRPHDEGRRGRRVRHPGTSLVRCSRRSTRRAAQPPQPAGRTSPNSRRSSSQERSMTTTVPAHAFVLLSTKLHPPRRRRTLLARPRLRDLATRSGHHALTLVSAPAGFGKSTLVD